MQAASEKFSFPLTPNASGSKSAYRNMFRTVSIELYCVSEQYILNRFCIVPIPNLVNNIYPLQIVHAGYEQSKPVRTLQTCRPLTPITNFTYPTLHQSNLLLFYTLIFFLFYLLSFPRQITSQFSLPFPAPCVGSFTS